MDPIGKSHLFPFKFLFGPRTNSGMLFSFPFIPATASTKEVRAQDPESCVPEKDSKFESLLLDIPEFWEILHSLTDSEPIWGCTLKKNSLSATDLHIHVSSSYQMNSLDTGRSTTWMVLPECKCNKTFARSDHCRLHERVPEQVWANTGTWLCTRNICPIKLTSVAPCLLYAVWKGKENTCGLVKQQYCLLFPSLKKKHWLTGVTRQGLRNFVSSDIIDYGLKQGLQA